MKKLITVAISAALCLALSACGAKVTNIKVELPQSIAQGESISARLIAEFDKTDLSDEKKDVLLKAVKLTWTSSDEKIITVDKNGMVTGVSGGIATILLFGKGKNSEYSFTTQIKVTY